MSSDPPDPPARPADSTARSVLFICTGNLCRSPAAEAILRKLAEQQPASASLFVDSAGTIAGFSGGPADARMIDAAARRGYAVTSIVRRVTRADLETFDHVVAMDRDHLAFLRRLHATPTAQLRLLSQWLDPDGWPIDVPDPYGEGPAGFESVLDMIEEACQRMLDRGL